MKKNVAICMIIAVCLVFLTVGCRTDTSSGRQDPNDMKPHAASGEKTKPVILIIIDSLMDKPLQEAIRQKHAPAMEFLIKNGEYIPKVVSSFPTMSVTIDSTLLTGTYADRHHVPGLVWYNDNDKRMVFYGNGAKEALKIDQMQVFMDAVYQLNQVQLNKETKTIHEELAERGKESASINAVVFRGKTDHTLRVPQLIKSSKRVPDELKITGPKWFSYAALAQLDPKNDRNTRLWKKFGMNNDFSAQDIAFLIRQHKLPDVTIAYFPENDSTTHRKGPGELEGIVQADQALQVVMNAYGSWEQAIKQARWIVMGDSSQSYVYDDRQTATVEIMPLLNRYRIAELNQPVTTKDQIVISANERMAYVYAIDDKVKESDIVKLLQNEDKLDIIAMKNGPDIQITAGKRGGMLAYHPGGDYTDEYGQAWTLSGDPALADITIRGNRIKYGKYPDILARLHGAMHSHEGRYVVLTVKPGYELVSESSPTHIGGGAHGSLHEKDSLVPIIVTGTSTRPKTLRIVDMKDWILQLTNE